MEILFPVGLATIAVIFVLSYRKKRDRGLLTERVTAKGGTVVALGRTKKGHPFSDTGRGWWAWRVHWRDGSGEHVSWALTTRDGIQEWRD